ncbi:MAG: sugar ABC transporter ATP-binding protein [Clostridiales bacterium]|nr:sugar ABC transporter ATP-binding protein [Clostridiales bacterium]
MELSLKGIRKSFGAGNVLDGADFDVRGGEICALIGENGAGKSTLMNIVGGVLLADGGDMLIDGKKVSFSSPAESLGAGIAFIHQELNLVNDLTVYENMFLSGFLKKGPFLDKNAMIEQTKNVFSMLGIDIDPKIKVGELDASYKQLVEIARAFAGDASLIIMDEPTASLTENETERVFDIMRTLKKRGIAIIFISHKLDEVMNICDRFTVLRNGVCVKSGNISGESAGNLASYMVGHGLNVGTRGKRTRSEHETLRLEHLSDGKSFFDISLSLCQGEILGVTGLLGDGQSELFETVFGAGGKYTGKILLGGKEIRLSGTHEALKYGLAYLPKNRKENAVIPDMSIVDNGTAVTLDSYVKNLLFDKNAQSDAFVDGARKLRISMADEKKLITTLSGGNQQKAVLEKWLLSSPRVLILDNPTQGVDVGAKEDFYSIIESLAESGISVIVLSPEAKEIARVCDRAIVMRSGRIAAELSGDEMNEKNMMLYATGAEKEDAKRL